MKSQTAEQLYVGLIWAAWGAGVLSNSARCHSRETPHPSGLCPARGKSETKVVLLPAATRDPGAPIQWLLHLHPVDHGGGFNGLTSNRSHWTERNHVSTLSCVWGEWGWECDLAVNPKGRRSGLGASKSYSAAVRSSGGSGGNGGDTPVTKHLHM